MSYLGWMEERRIYDIHFEDDRHYWISIGSSARVVQERHRPCRLTHKGDAEKAGAEKGVARDREVEYEWDRIRHGARAVVMEAVRGHRNQNAEFSIAEWTCGSFVVSGCNA